MRERWILVSLLALALVTLGCLGVGDDGPEADDAEPDAEERPPTDAADEQEGTGGSGQARGNASAGGADEDRGPLVHHLNGTFTAEAANLGASEADRSLEVDVASDAQAIVAELRWEGTADLDLALLAPGFCEDPATPVPFADLVCVGSFFLTGDKEHAYGTDRTSPAVQEAQQAVRVDASTIAEESCEDDACEWTAHVNPNAAVDTAFQLRVSVFPDEAPAEGYSALD